MNEKKGAQSGATKTVNNIIPDFDSLVKNDILFRDEQELTISEASFKAALAAFGTPRRAA